MKTLSRQMRFLAAIAALLGLAAITTEAAEPALPSGLPGKSSAAPPALPSGLGDSQRESEELTERATNDRWDGWEVTGFAELRAGTRLGNAPGYSDTTLAEARFQTQIEKIAGEVVFRGVADLVYDAQANQRRFDWETGTGWLDARELNAAFPLGDDLDVKLGRQIATWGVGDLLFINDLFPKDWNAFFLGRDLEYLKAPQDSLRISAYPSIANVEVVYSPRFEPDRFVDGRRLSMWDPSARTISSSPSSMRALSPGDAFEADEVHLRVNRLFRRFELAAYGYRGYWKSPAGVDRSGKPLFPRLDVYGASARGPLGRGIISAEAGWYESGDEPDGSGTEIRNSEWRGLLGYEQEIGNQLTGALQYYVERVHDAPASRFAGERHRELVTVRVTKQLLRQTLTLSGFAFYSPSQRDSHIRLSASWKANDEWRWDLGAHFFGGGDASFFGQFEGNESVFLAARRSF